MTSADTKYLTEKPKHVVTTKTIKTYTDANFKIEHGSIQAGSLVTISDMGYSSKGTPRLITQDQHYITANKDFVMPMKLEKKDGYISKVPKRIKIIKKCKLYSDVSFKNDPIQTLKPNDELNIMDISYTRNQTPRLKTVDGYFVTANKQFVKVLH
ncbi:DUF5776 domain-containing protein [Staphylococcus saccharolyticus]|uniref:DUF5776 domain-containing protein n=1 Tax=Staphylococcus saccharolyticus TaxID=33028 RepID=UPI0032DF8691